MHIKSDNWHESIDIANYYEYTCTFRHHVMRTRLLHRIYIHWTLRYTSFKIQCLPNASNFRKFASEGCSEITLSCWFCFKRSMEWKLRAASDHWVFTDESEHRIGFGICLDWSLQTLSLLGNDSRLELTRMKREHSNYRKDLRHHKVFYEGNRYKSKGISSISTDVFRFWSSLMFYCGSGAD